MVGEHPEDRSVDAFVWAGQGGGASWTVCSRRRKGEVGSEDCPRRLVTLERRVAWITLECAELFWPVSY